MNDVKDTVFIIRLLTRFEQYCNIIFRGIFAKLNGYNSVPTLFYYVYLKDMVTIVPYNSTPPPRPILKTSINTTLGYRSRVYCV